MRKRSLLLTAGACLATLTLAMGMAFADPTNAPTFRQLAGTGSDTIQDVMNGFGNGYGSPTVFDGIKDSTGTRVLGSYDAVPAGSNITTKDPAVNPNCTFARPQGSGQGVQALINHTADGCLQFARSSTNNSASFPGANLTYIPFAVDAVTYVTRGTSNVSKALTIANLQTVYNCSGPAGGTNPSILPVLPHFGSGTRSFFLQSLGFTDAANFVSQPGHTCIRDVSNTVNPGAPLEENDGRELGNDKELAPYSIAQWIAEVNNQNNVADRHGTVLLREIKDSTGAPVTPLVLNTSSPLNREVYNVVPNSQVGAGGLVDSTFVGPSSAICSNPNTIKAYGFGPDSNCGSTTLHTP